MELSEIRGEHALDVLADLLDPITEILSDPKIKEVVMHGTKIAVAREAIKGHKQAVITMLALLDDKNPDEYNPTLPEIVIKTLGILNDPALQSFFALRGQNLEGKAFGSAMANTKATENE